MVISEQNYSELTIRKLQKKDHENPQNHKSKKFPFSIPIMQIFNQF